MASKKQIAYIKGLCEELGHEAEDDSILENYTYSEVQEAINELTRMKEEHEGTDDDCYWYD